MGKYVVKQFIHHQMIITYADEFDTRDQNKWKELRDQAADFLDDNEMTNYPEEAPEDPKIWLSLYEAFPDHGFGELESEDVITARKGGYEFSCELYDENDNPIV